MRPILAVLIVVALGIAGVTAYLANRFLGEQEAKQQELSEAPPPIATDRVLVAARPIKAGSVLVEDDFSYQEWPRDAVPGNLLLRGDGGDPKKEHVGAIAARDFIANEPIPSAALLRQDEASLLSAIISPGMEAFTIRIGALSSAAGFVGPGDRVDVLLTRTESVKAPGAPEARVIFSERMLRDVRVLAIGRRTSRDGGGAENATLEVTPRQAQMLAVAERMGDLTLVLGSLVADGAPPAPDGAEAGRVVTSLDVSQAFRHLNRDLAFALFGDGDPGAQPPVRQARPAVQDGPRATAAAAPTRRDAVEVTLIRGGVATTRTFVRAGN